MKTALQELIEIIESSKQDADIQGVGICEVLDYHGIHDKATELLEKEREQIENAHANGIHDASACINGEKFKTSEEYYNETYNQKQIRWQQFIK